MPKRPERIPVEEKGWYQAQLLVAAWLRGRGIACSPAGYFDPYDILTDSGKRVEVKFCAYSTQSGGWSFNIHRHNVLNESEVDIYVLRLEPGWASPVLGNHAFHLVLRAPLGRPTIFVTPRSLLTKYAKFFNDMEPFGEYAIVPEAGIAASQSAVTQ